MALLTKEIHDDLLDLSQLLDNADVSLISTILANQIRRYQHLGWSKEKDLQTVYKRMQEIHVKLQTYQNFEGRG